MQDIDSFDAYYREFDAKKRKEMLERQMQSAPTPENELRKKLYDMRHGETAENGMPIDRFVRAWVNLGFLSKNMQSRFGFKKRKKEMMEILKDLSSDFKEENGDLGKEILFQEYCQFARMIVNLNQNDQNYSCLILGIGKMKEGKLMDKIKEEIYKNTRELPEVMGLSEEFELFAKAFPVTMPELFS